MTKKSEMFISHGRSDTPRILFVYCKLAGTKNPRLHKGPKHFGGEVSMQLPAADAHTLTLTGVFWGRLGFDERSILQWSQIQQLDITEVASLRFLYGFLWDSYGFFINSYGFLWIPSHEIEGKNGRKLF